MSTSQGSHRAEILLSDDVRSCAAHALRNSSGAVDMLDKIAILALRWRDGVASAGARRAVMHPLVEELPANARIILVEPERWMAARSPCTRRRRSF